MRTSLIELEQIENYILGNLGTGEKLLMDSRSLFDSELREKIAWQQNTYTLIRQLGRQKFRNELENINKKLFTSPDHQSFAKKILGYFNL